MQFVLEIISGLSTQAQVFLVVGVCVIILAMSMLVFLIVRDSLRTENLCKLIDAIARMVQSMRKP